MTPCDNLRRLPLAGTRNTRELGGYPCAGGVTRWGVFLRSDNPGELTGGDLDALRRYGLTDVVDLRRADEQVRYPSALAGVSWATVHPVPLSPVVAGGNFEGDVPGSMAGLYIDLVDNARDQVARVIRALAEAGGCALFHCAVGKDRTGVVAMLLHKLCGVADPDIVADYAVSEIYMREEYDAQAAAFREFSLPEHILHSIPASMERLLAHLAGQYGNVADYLRGCGVAQHQLDRLRDKFIQPL